MTLKYVSAIPEVRRRDSEDGDELILGALHTGKTEALFRYPIDNQYQAIQCIFKTLNFNGNVVYLPSVANWRRQYVMLYTFLHIYFGQEVMGFAFLYQR